MSPSPILTLFQVLVIQQSPPGSHRHPQISGLLSSAGSKRPISATISTCSDHNLTTATNALKMSHAYSCPQNFTFFFFFFPPQFGVDSPSPPRDTLAILTGPDPRTWPPHACIFGRKNELLLNIYLRGGSFRRFRSSRAYLDTEQDLLHQTPRGPCTARAV
ncbi:hypothetical protein FN846DRAFT_529011 [Sphaerosporella brunnea]|uniref:Uncharacterized protein n=1 Tax=Sphaerosporella brunnea TaxID=1250544 RepID=A0A5J5EDG2_9PEZI|nr:hypothetical protein FN846DRAFT_529011 [Sphaerosporella brunnea]